ncbi:hypothetical protein [Herminiimonas sp. CN]|uniref:hypothetical protein n=1 Tax=Herminiimonas sp. CN TaxID=1349818 RepID=UPI000474111F|nr:hypothetical protein [Herminiimonas sp. CN]
MSAGIDALINDARGFAATTFDGAQGAMNSAQSAISGISGGTSAHFAMPGLPQLPPFAPAVAPTFSAPGFVTPTRPNAPEMPTPIPDPLGGLGGEPHLNASSPNINLDAIPKPSQLGSFVGTAPTVRTDFTFPDAPDLIVPALPNIVDRTAPTKPDILLPRFDALKPDDLGAAPSDYAEQFTTAYRDAAPSMVAALDGQLDSMLARYNPQYKNQMSRIEDKLSTYLDGGTALSPATENAIYERSRDKVNAEYRRTRDLALKDAAKRGFTLPSGALFSAMQQARQGGADNNARASTEIAVKQAELEQQNMQWAVTTSTGLRTAVLSASISYHQNLIGLNGQALEYAKSILSAMIEIYNTLVKAYQAKLEGYKAEASVFETKLKGALASIELFKAEIAALQALTQVDVAKVGVYREQISAMTSLVTMYRTRIDAVVSQASLEKLKLEMFGQQVQAYAVQTQAKTAEWQGFTAAVGGEEAKARVYGTQVQAYAAEWTGYKAKVEAKSEQVRAVAMSNQAKATYAAAQVNAFSALVGAEGSRVSSMIQYQNQTVQAYQVASQAAVAAAQSATANYKAVGDIGVAVAGMDVQAQLGSAQVNLARAKAVADTAMTAGSVYGQLASAALSGMNTLVVNNA